MKKILNPEHRIDKHEASTEGIVIKNWKIPMKSGNHFVVNFWDFGGQEIYHATHQFFFTKCSKKYNYITYRNYEYYCKKLGVNKKQAWFLSRYFHDLGFFLHFHDSPILKDIVFLKPDWATGVVYQLIDTKQIVDNKGVFTYDQLQEIWKEYRKNKYIHLVELMKRFELYFQLPNTYTYIIPELLPVEKPRFGWRCKNNLRFEYHYSFMPAGIITRFIVRTHDLNKKRIFWKNGTVLVYESTLAMVTSNRLDKKIRIWIFGNNKKDLFAIIRREIEYIHETLNIVVKFCFFVFL